MRMFGEPTEVECTEDADRAPALAPELSDQFAAVLQGGDPGDVFASCLAVAAARLLPDAAAAIAH